MKLLYLKKKYGKTKIEFYTTLLVIIVLILISCSNQLEKDIEEYQSDNRAGPNIINNSIQEMKFKWKADTTWDDNLDNNFRRLSISYQRSLQFGEDNTSPKFITGRVEDIWQEDDQLYICLWHSSFQDIFFNLEIEEKHLKLLKDSGKRVIRRKYACIAKIHEVGKLNISLNSNSAEEIYLYNANALIAKGVCLEILSLK